MESASDREIWKTAQDNDFVIVTRDSRAVILKILIDNLITIEDALFAKNLACLELT
jgi:predicted nuclease of predicted toxin-antitoxin system